MSKMSGGGINVIGDIIQHVAAGSDAVCELSAVGFSRENIDINILSPSKVPVTYRIKEDDGLFNIVFKPTEVGTYAMDIYVSGEKIPESPVFFKVYDSGRIRVSEIRNGVVGQPCQFRVDASQAGEGQLEISINDGEVPNHVQVLGGGRCLVHFTPEAPKPHTIDIKFNGEPVPGCPFICQMADTSKVSVALHHLELMPVNKKADFQIHVDTTDNAELAVSVTGPRKDIPVQVTGNVKDGFVASFLPDEVGPYVIGVEYNNVAVGGTPFTGKAYDSNNVIVSSIPWGTIGKNLEFTVDASRAGEGNLEITISARGRNIPTQVHPQGSARFVVSFVPLEATDHQINITFNKESVPGAPFCAKIHTDPNRILVSGHSLAATAVGKSSFFTLSNVIGSSDDLDIVIDAPNGESIPAETKEGDQEGEFKVEFCPEIAGEHQIYLSFGSEPIPGSPFACKVYNVEAIKVRECAKGIVGKPVTFLVETSRAGPGNLEVTVNNGQVPTSAQAQGNHTYAISFIPKEPKPHIVELKFNGENVPGSPFKCAVVDAAKVNLSGEGLEKVPVGKAATFFIEGQFDMGDPEVKILTPAKRVLPSSIRFIGEGHFAVDYTPTAVGDHQVEVKMGDVQVQGSPFVIKAYDVSKVLVSNITQGSVAKPVYFSIDASQAGAGNLEIIVSVNGRNVPNYVQSEGNAKFRVNFKPLEAIEHLLSVKFNNEFVPGSPFTCEIQGNKVVTLSGSGINLCPVKKEALFTIESPIIAAEDGSTGQNDTFEVGVFSPSGHEIEAQLNRREESSNNIDVSYTPTEVGPHIVKISQDGIPVDGSPFTCNVYDVAKISVTNLPSKCPLGKSVTFTVDASKAGEGTLELVVTTTKTSVRAEVQARSRGLYDVTFVPHDLSPHYINITFNEEHINNSPFECAITEGGGGGGGSSGGHLQFSAADEEETEGPLRGEGVRSAIRGRQSFFDVESEQFPQNMNVRIIDQKGAALPYEKQALRHGLYRLYYKPTTVGMYSVECTTLVHGKPQRKTYPVNVYDPAKVHLLKSASPIAGENNTLIIDTNGAGRGALSINIRAAGQEIKHSIRDIGNGRFEVTYFPEIPIPHKVDVKFNNNAIAGSPTGSLDLNVKDPAAGKVVTASGIGLYQAKVGMDTCFVIDTLGLKSKDFDILVTGPADAIPPFEAIPLRCYQQKDGKLLAEYKANTCGVHKIEVMVNGQHIRNSPFECHAFDPEAVYIVDLPTSSSQLIAGKPVRFKVDRRKAGVADLEVIGSSPLGGHHHIPVEVKGLYDERGIDLIEFRPELAGEYKFTIKYGDAVIPDTPLTFAISERHLSLDDRTGRGMMQDIPSSAASAVHGGEFRAFGQGLQKGTVNTPTRFEIEQGGEHVPPPEITIFHPKTSKPVKASIEKTSPSSIQVTYIPDMIGIYLIQVRQASGEVLEYPVNVCNPKAIKLLSGYNPETGGFSPKLSRDRDTIVVVYLGEAGPGKLEAELTRPSGSTVKVDVHPAHDRGEIRFRPQENGMYDLHIKYNGFLLPLCPIKGSTASSPNQKSRAMTTVASSASSNNIVGKVRLTGVGLVKAVCNENNFFIIDGSKAATQATPSSSLVPNDSNGREVAVQLRQIANAVYEAIYIPKVPGSYSLSISWGDKMVKGCPINVNITEGTVPNTPASRVSCSGEGLRVGTLGKDIRSFIDTRKAGPGELSLHCVGPRGKTAYCELNDHQDGTFTLNLKPQEAGRHQLSVKYGGQHVPNSPFIVRVSGAPDPEKVKVYGPGVEHGVLAMYQSRFICDTRGAGAGQLTVRIRGPKGAFRVEMQRESQKDRTILCKYEPTEPGDYRIEVKWSGDHVPGSPFMVMIFDTQEELSRFLQSGYSPHGITSDIYNGSVATTPYYGRAVPWAGTGSAYRS